MAALIGVGMLIALVTDGWDRDRGGPPRDGAQEEQQRGPGGLVVIAGGILLVGGAATALAYRRISRPVGELLGAAEQVAEGDYGVGLKPDGPRELRLLTTTFNDMAERLAATDEQRRRFLADITHELRTPLAVLQSEVEAQLDGIHPRNDQHLGSLLEEILRLGRLVDDLHTLALADAGRIVLNRETVSPLALVEEAIEAHASLARRRGVELRLAGPTSPPSPAPGADAGATSTGPPELPDIEVDPTRIRQVLDNLLSNAVRHTPADGEVVVAVAPVPEVPGTAPGAHLRFTVTDAGPGFPADQLHRVFERFVRSADSSGSGLGLSIARDLVRAHGGTIEAGNDPTTGGATVTFTLPRRRSGSG